MHRCGRIEDDYGDFAGWIDGDIPIEHVTEYYDEPWLKRERVVKVIPRDDTYPYDRRVYELVELLCPDCIRKRGCEVCGEPAYAVDEHLVCEDHEDHDFGDRG